MRCPSPRLSSRTVPHGYCGFLHPLGTFSFLSLALHCPLCQPPLLTRTGINFGDLHPVSANSDIPPGCGNGVMWLLPMVNSGGTGLQCSRSGLRVCCGSQVSSWKGVCKEEGFRVFPKQIQTFKFQHRFHLLRGQ